MRTLWNTYNPFGRLRKVFVRDPSQTDLVAEYRYNGLGFRIGQHTDLTDDGTYDEPDGVVNGDDPWFWFCYDENWRIVAAFRADDEHPKEVFVHHNAGLDGVGGSSYIDSIIMRDRDANTVWFDEADSTREERTYYLQNWRHDVSIMLTHAGSMIQWIKYSAYGVPFGIPAGDVNADGQVTQDDANLAGTWYLAPHYDVRADIDLDGDLDFDDLTILAAARDAGHTIGRGHLSRDEVGLRRGYAGYEYDTTFTGAGRNLYHVRNRVYDADLGRWTRRDPLGYVDGMSLYAYVSLMAIIATDPMGLAIYVDGGGAPINPTAAGGSPCDVGGGSMLAAMEAGGCSVDRRESLCEHRLTQCDSDPLIAGLKVSITKKGCKLPRIKCRECDGTEDAHYNPDNNTIVVCWNNILGDTFTYCIAIRHELQHALDHCGGDTETTCEAIACREARAAHLSGQCCPNSTYRQRCQREGKCRTYRECIKHYTWLSTQREANRNNAGCDRGDSDKAAEKRSCVTPNASPCPGWEGK